MISIKRLCSITCVINVRNGEKYIAETIASLLNQTIIPKILVIDNQSTDKTTEIVGQISGVRLIKTESLMTLGQARNFSLNYVDTDYVAWVDSDDIWSDQLLCEHYQSLFLENSEVVLIGGACKFIDKNGSHLPGKIQDLLHFNKVNYHTRVGDLRGKVFYGDDLYNVLLHNHEAGAWCSYVFKTDAVRGVGGFEAKLMFAEDYELIAKLVSTGLALFINKAYCSYRIHDSQITRVINPEIINYEIMYVLNKYSYLLTHNEVLNVIAVTTAKAKLRTFKMDQTSTKLMGLMVSAINIRFIYFLFKYIYVYISNKINRL